MKIGGVYVKFLGLWTWWVIQVKQEWIIHILGGSSCWLISSDSSHGEWAGFSLLRTHGDESDVCAIPEHGHFSDAETWDI